MSRKIWFSIFVLAHLIVVGFICLKVVELCPEALRHSSLLKVLGVAGGASFFGAIFFARKV
jgi:hypothetical protein